MAEAGLPRHPQETAHWLQMLERESVSDPLTPPQPLPLASINPGYPRRVIPLNALPSFSTLLMALHYLLEVLDKIPSLDIFPNYIVRIYPLKIGLIICKFHLVAASWPTLLTPCIACHCLRLGHVTGVGQDTISLYICNVFDQNFLTEIGQSN